ncbi:DUF4238 domain-containing protein [Streptomyces sp. NPDC059409]|uniref:DUF4238 domain-containing protein n=1 Tax=Streptomyces sp. NPDC059409 TaxID=3346824 RepID=UPI00369D8E0A
MGSAKKDLKRNNHTVPRSYLERFAGEFKQVSRLRLEDGVCKDEPIKRSTVIRDFYLMETADGQWSDAAEDVFGVIENGGIQAIRAAVDDRIWPLPDKHRGALSVWVALQHVRVPAVRQGGDEVADFMLKLSVAVNGKPRIQQLLAERLGRPPTDEEVEAKWKKLTDFDSYKVKQHPNKHLKLINELGPRAAGHFYDSAWWICRFENEALLTTDCPVALVPRAGAEDDGVGLATAQMFLVPLDRRAGLVIQNCSGPDRELPASAEIAHSFNQQLVLNAHRSVFHHPDDQPLTGLHIPGVRVSEISIGADLKEFLSPDGWRGGKA